MNIDKFKKFKIFLLSIFVIGIASILLGFDFDFLRVGPKEGYEQSVTTKLINETKDQNIQLETEAEGISIGHAGLFAYSPLNQKWVEPGKTGEGKSTTYAATGPARIAVRTGHPTRGTLSRFSFVLEGSKTKSPVFFERKEPVDLKLKVIIDAKPIKIYALAVDPNYTFYNYTITVEDAS